MTARRTRGKEREEHIIEAATQAIAERGLANVRIADIAERAGMSPGHVTYYFPSKIDLLMRAITASEEALSADVAAAITRVRDPWKRLDKLVELSASSGRSDPGWVLWFQVWLEAALDPEVAREHDELDARWRAVLTDVIRYGVERGEFDVPDPDAAARILSATIDGLSIQLTLGSEGIDRAQMLRLFGLAARAQLGGDRR